MLTDSSSPSEKRMREEGERRREEPRTRRGRLRRGRERVRGGGREGGKRRGEGGRRPIKSRTKRRKGAEGCGVWGKNGMET